MVVSVRDTGIGIPADALPRIFDMFSQVDRSIERSTGGLGIGLALVKGLVEMHGGTVTAASGGQGKGSTFTVKLPALGSHAEPLSAAPPDGAQAAAGPKRRILVVDDNRDSATSMAMLLKLLGNEVRTAHDGVEAVEAAERFRPEVVLMDVGMPRLDGYEATRRIREQPWGKAMTIIALTGWGQEGDKLQSREAGCNGHLVKPVNLTDLEKLLTTPPPPPTSPPPAPPFPVPPAAGGSGGGPSLLCPVVYGPPPRGGRRGGGRLPAYNFRRNSISPTSSFHGTRPSAPPTSQVPSALAFISRSTSAYTLVVASDTCPSQARIVLMSTPARSRCVAVVCRIVCGLIDGSITLRHREQTGAPRPRMVQQAVTLELNIWASDGGSQSGAAPTTHFGVAEESMTQCVGPVTNRNPRISSWLSISGCLIDIMRRVNLQRGSACVVQGGETPDVPATTTDGAGDRPLRGP